MTKEFDGQTMPETRPEDGVGTHAANADWGAAGTALLRLAPTENGADGTMSGADRPNPRDISNAVAAQSGPTTNTAGASDFLWIWGQFLDHDLSLTEAGDTVAANIPVPTGDPFFDPFFTGTAEIHFNRVDQHDGAYVNEITAYIDASMIYGSDAEMIAAMRVDGGKLAMTEDAQLALEGTTLQTGDVRAAENIALSSMHTIFTREHNRIVDELAAAHPDMTSDALFDTARAHVEAIVQAITYNAFLPVLVGDDALAAYAGFDDTVNPGISAEFSTAVFRLGHTLLSSNLQKVTEEGETLAPLALRDAFFRPSLLGEPDLIEDLLRGAATQTAQAVDTMVVEDVRSFLFGPPGAGGFDLAALNIQRGRDLGIASYNNLREALGLDRAESFDDITSDPALAARLAAVYGSVELVDAWVGGLAEDPVDGALLGEMFSLVLIDQFTRLRDGDPFWSEGRTDLSPEVVAELWSTTLSDVIQRNTDVDALQSDVFLALDRMIGDQHDNKLKGDGQNNFIVGAEGADVLHGHGGRDELQGGHGDDRLMGGDGDDTLLGGKGDDRLDGGEDDDALFGNHGADRLFGLDGDDTLDGGMGTDRLRGGDGNDLLHGGNNNDMLRGEDGDDTLDGGDGNDDLIGGDGNDMLTGGEGKDMFVFDAGLAQHDVITDFELGIDTVRLKGLGQSSVDLTRTDDGDVLLEVAGGAQITFAGLAEDVTDDGWLNLLG